MTHGLEPWVCIAHKSYLPLMREGDKALLSGGATVARLNGPSRCLACF